ncbi:GtrA family protein [Streptomyces niveus]|uniref:GtrA family protein n=1 Tax=Streptomyces niveus TaxID=193462 RepID=UPI003654D0B7
MGRVQTPHSHAGELTQEIAKFGFVGGTGVLLNLVALNLGRHFGHLPVIHASVIATLIAIAFNYVGFRYFTYRDRGKRDYTREIVLFLMFSLIGLVIENGTIYIATYAFGWDSALQSSLFKFLGIGVATVFRFWSYRTWVFTVTPKRKPDGSSTVEIEVGERFDAD